MLLDCQWQIKKKKINIDPDNMEAYSKLQSKSYSSWSCNVFLNNTANFACLVGKSGYSVYHSPHRSQSLKTKIRAEI